MDRLLGLIPRRIGIEPITPLKEIPAQVTSGVAKAPRRDCTRPLPSPGFGPSGRTIPVPIPTPSTLHAFSHAQPVPPRVVWTVRRVSSPDSSYPRRVLLVNVLTREGASFRIARRGRKSLTPAWLPDDRSPSWLARRGGPREPREGSQGSAIRPRGAGCGSPRHPTRNQILLWGGGLPACQPAFGLVAVSQAMMGQGQEGKPLGIVPIATGLNAFVQTTDGVLERPARYRAPRGS